MVSGALAPGAAVAGAATAFPLSVRHVSVRTVHGRVVGTATIANTGQATVRSTTGSLGLGGPSGGATGLVTFAVPSLAAGSSKPVRFTTKSVGALHVGSGTHKVLVCADVYSQIQRFAQNTHCRSGPAITISARGVRRPSGPAPKTIIRTGAARVTTSSTSVFRFVSTVRRSTFACSLDGGPWLACRSPHGYTALVGGAHTFGVRAVSSTGKPDPSPARSSWRVAATSTTPGQDNFNRADGDLGGSWAAMRDGGLSIASHAVVGTAEAHAGDIRVAETYGGDQYSTIEVTSKQVSGSDWIGPTVRSQNRGQNTYLGIYFSNNGKPQLRLYKRTAGTFAQLGNSYDSGTLSAGTKLTLRAVGSQITFQQNGVDRITVADSSLAGGAPGLMTYGAATADNWSGGNATGSPSPSPPPSPSPIQYVSTDAHGVASYAVNSSDNGHGTHVLRVLAPTNPAPGVPHNFLYVLPVEPELGTMYGDGLETFRALDAQDQYNLTIVEPSFAVDPWYADNPSDPGLRYETFMTKDLVPWVTQNFASSGHEQNWLIGFSKSGIGATDLLLKHPDVFALAAAWDFPADMSSYSQFGGSSTAAYGTDANFQANYRLTQAFVDTRKTPFLSNNRIWIGGYHDFQTDMTDFDSLLTSEGIAHTTEAPQSMLHRWDSGWVTIALSALRQDSAALPATP